MDDQTPRACGLGIGTVQRIKQEMAARLSGRSFSHRRLKALDLLKISVKTVETHRAAIMRKLKLSSPAALIRYAIRNRIVES